MRNDVPCIGRYQGERLHHQPKSLRMKEKVIAWTKNLESSGLDTWAPGSPGSTFNTCEAINRLALQQQHEAPTSLSDPGCNNDLFSAKNGQISWAIVTSYYTSRMQESAPFMMLLFRFFSGVGICPGPPPPPACASLWHAPL